MFFLIACISHCVSSLFLLVSLQGGHTINQLRPEQDIRIAEHTVF